MSAHRILIVDDYPAARYALGAILGAKGWEVLEADSVAAALRIINSPDPPDSMVLDMRLPDGNGDAVLRVVREHNLPIRVAVCSGMDLREYAQALAGCYPDAMVQKPVRAEDLDRIFEAALAPS
jgi:CheY-like chemotaxis protein